MKQLLLEDGSRLERNFESEIAEWKPESSKEDRAESDVEEVLYSVTSGETDKFKVELAYPVEIVRKEDYGSSEVQIAMKAELDKYKSFGAYEEVEDKGQHRIPIRWVVSKQIDSGKNQPIKARLCIRGDLERNKSSIRSDSPTAAKETLKIALMIAANEGFTIKSIDIKSAYLQGNDLKRDIYVQPPGESESKKMWKLKKAAYGILDGGRLFYLRLEETLKQLGLHKVHAEGALFSYVRNGKLNGIVVSHVDDLFLAGNELFRNDVETKLEDIFQLSKSESGSFKYCGCNIVTLEDGSIRLDQNEYTEKLNEIDIINGDDDSRILTPSEQKKLRGKIGEILWISLMSRPDLAFDTNSLASEVPKATVKTMKEINAVIRKAKNRRESIIFSKLGDVNKLNIKLYTDASYNNIDGQTRSTEGRVVLAENPLTGKVCVLSWKTKKIARVCRSVKSAETRSLDDGLDDAIHTARN